MGLSLTQNHARNLDGDQGAYEITYDEEFKNELFQLSSLSIYILFYNFLEPYLPGGKMDTPKALNKTLIVMKLMSYIYLLLAILILILGIITNNGSNFNALSFGLIMFSSVFTFAFAIVYSKVHYGLLEGKFWAWVTGIILSGLMLPSIFIVFGIPSLIGLLDKTSKDFFNEGPVKTKLQSA